MTRGAHRKAAPNPSLWRRADTRRRGGRARDFGPDRPPS